MCNALDTALELPEEEHYVGLLKSCTAMDKDDRLPNIDEANAIFLNAELTGWQVLPLPPFYIIAFL